MTLQGPSVADNSNPAHIDALTSPRFLFGLYVLFKHSGGQLLINSGHAPQAIVNLISNAEVSISYFFTMSGFILAYVYYGKFRSWGAVVRYGRARFARVYPVFFLSLILLLPFVAFISLKVDIWQFFLLQMWTPLAVPHGVLTSNWNMQSWTLSVELACYLTFPSMLARLEYFSNTAIVAATAIVCALMVALRLPAIDQAEHVLYSWELYVPYPILRMPEFIYGVLLGILYRRGVAPQSKFWLHVLIVATLVLLLATHSLWVNSALAVVMGIIVLLMTTSLREGWLAAFLNHPTMVTLGRASYALYILQLPVHRILDSAGFGLVGKLAYMPVMIVTSIIVFYLYEEPLQKFLRGTRATDAKAAQPARIA